MRLKKFCLWWEFEYFLFCFDTSKFTNHIIKVDLFSHNLLNQSTEAKDPKVGVEWLICGTISLISAWRSFFSTASDVVRVKEENCVLFYARPAGEQIDNSWGLLSTNIAVKRLLSWFRHSDLQLGHLRMIKHLAFQTGGCTIYCRERPLPRSGKIGYRLQQQPNGCLTVPLAHL